MFLLLFLPSWSLLGTGLQQQQIGMESHGPRPLLPAINGVSGTRGDTQLFFKLKVFMLKMKLNFI